MFISRGNPSCSLHSPLSPLLPCPTCPCPTTTPLQAVYLIDKKGDNSTYFGFDL